MSIQMNSIYKMLFILMLAAPSVLIAGGKGNHHHGSDDGHHRHDSWEKPPEEYANYKYDKWTDVASAKRGKDLYEMNCVSCHGVSGKGDGPAGANLEHPPADLTNHFHNAIGDGDGYLFWRISEGGMAEPFRSQKSFMPPFKSILSKQQRWDVLTYIHQEFHRGFKLNGSQHDQTKHRSHNH